MLTALSQETKKITEHLKKESPLIPTMAGGPHPLEWNPWRNGRGNPQDFLLHNKRLIPIAKFLDVFIRYLEVL